MSGIRVLLRRVTAAARIDEPLMLIVMAVQTQKLPVAAVGRVVIMVMIAVMYGQFAQILMIELARATSTHPRIELQCLLAITALALIDIAPRGGHDLIEAILIARFFVFAHQLTLTRLPRTARITGAQHRQTAHQ
jgi:hypothetical protein